MSIDIHEKIREFCKNEDNVMAILAFVKVGKDRGDCLFKVTERMMADILFRFLKVPAIPGKS